jgi:hypothetical protein
MQTTFQQMGCQQQIATALPFWAPDSSCSCRPPLFDQRLGAGNRFRFCGRIVDIHDCRRNVDLL